MTVGSLRLGRLAIVVLGLWFVLLIYTSTVLIGVHKGSKNGDETAEGSKSFIGRGNRRHPSFPLDDSESSSSSSASSSLLEVRLELSRSLKDIDLLRRQNDDLKKKVLLLSKNGTRLLSAKPRLSALMVRNSENNNSTVSTYHLPIDQSSRSKFRASNAIALHIQHQTLRRAVENGLIELWFSVTSKLGKLNERFKGDEQESIAFNRLMDDITDQYRTVLSDAIRLGTEAGIEAERRSILSNLTRVVQNRINYLQNPSDCGNARKLVCHLNKGCGFGCQLHHVTYCLIVAYGTRRTMVLDSRGWRYSQRGWDSVFLPVSRTCRDFENGPSPESWRGEESQSGAQVVSLPIIDGIYPRPQYLPLSFPEEFADKLLALHGYPPAWWVGQFVWYLMRYQPEFQRDLATTAETRFHGSFRAPCVGIHVRRTDKVGSEAAFHPLDEYMRFVEQWYRLEDVKRTKKSSNSPKRVYMATDEPALFPQARRDYPNYTFLGDPDVAGSAQLSSRYSDSSLRGVVADIHFLASCDYLVCTFSSQVCRVAYELMQVLRGDAASRFHSLDDVYYFGGQEAHEQVAHFPHKASSPAEIDLQVGDLLTLAGNHWDGYSKGRNERSGQTGLYPSYKVREKWRIVQFPTYPELELDQPIITGTPADSQKAAL